MTKLFAVVLIAFIAGFGNWLLNPHRPMVIGSVSIKGALDGSYLLVDPRPTGDFDRLHVPGSVNLSEDALDSKIDAFLERWSPDTEVAIYCAHGDCSSARRLAELLKKDFGIENVKVAKGDWEKWAQR